MDKMALHKYTRLSMQNNVYKIAHSPDADDIFMYYAIAFGWIDCINKLENIALDIETLNMAAINKEYDICAISFSVYPLIYKDYALLRTAMSFGDGYGPKMIKLKNKQLKSNFKVALSGAHTTNAMIFKIKYPNAKIIYKNFLDIESSVLSGEVDAGVLIHESILNFSNKLEVEAFIYDIWSDLIKDTLPLPLGGMVMSRSIPLNKAISLEKSLIKAVQIAVRYKNIMSKMLLNQNLVRVNAEELDTYLNLYANNSSINMDDIQLRAIEKLYELGFNAKFYNNNINVKDCMLPLEYENLRFN